MMFADDVVLCAREKELDVLEVELEQWREALEKRGMKVSRAKTEYMCLPQVTEFKCLGSTLQSDGDMNTEGQEQARHGGTFDSFYLHFS